MDKHNNPFSNLSPGGVQSPEEAVAKAQIARRLGMGFVIIAVLLGILFLADGRFGDEGDALPVASKPEPPANLTINTPENRDAIPADPAASLPVGQTVGGQITPAQPVLPEPVIPAESGAPVAESPAQGATSTGSKTAGSRTQITRNAKPTPGVVHTVPIKPAVPATPPASAPVTAPEPRKPVTRLLGGGSHLLQAGVFSNYQKAEELHALLTLNGIPSTLETRVQVGPFTSKAEADAARAKLKSLGIESLMLPPRK